MSFLFLDRRSGHRGLDRLPHRAVDGVNDLD